MKLFSDTLRILRLASLVHSSVLVESVEDNDYGLVEDNCDEYFFNGFTWPLPNSYNNSIRLCQGLNGHAHKYATLYSMEDGIPIYSAYIGNRSPDKEHHPRPKSKWTRLSKSLCFSGDYDPTKAYASRIANVNHHDWEFCGVHQTTNDDYHGEHDLIHIDRGHVDPNEINNEDPEAQDVTFTLTNVAPQASIFNEHSWREYECMAREYMMYGHPGKDHYIITGTHGFHSWMKGQTRNVRVPEFYWKAQCYSGDDITWAWAVMIPNLNDKKSADDSAGAEVMTVAELTEKYLGGPIFDELCQGAELGPWKDISENWGDWQTTLGCHFPAYPDEDNKLRFNPDH